MTAPIEIDWLDEALSAGWPLDRIEALAESAAHLRAAPTFIHADVIVLERDPIRMPFAAPGARFTALREPGTTRGIARANAALATAGMEQAA